MKCEKDTKVTNKTRKLPRKFLFQARDTLFSSSFFVKILIPQIRKLQVFGWLSTFINKTQNSINFEPRYQLIQNSIPKILKD